MPSGTSRSARTFSSTAPRRVSSAHHLAGPDAHPPQVLRRHERHRLRLDLRRARWRAGSSRRCASAPARGRSTAPSDIRRRALRRAAARRPARSCRGRSRSGSRSPKMISWPGWSGVVARIGHRALALQPLPGDVLAATASPAPSRRRPRPGRRSSSPGPGAGRSPG